MCLGSIRTYLNLMSPIWDPLGPFQTHWNPLGPIRTLWDPLGPIGTHWDPLNFCSFLVFHENFLYKIRHGIYKDSFKSFKNRWDPLGPIGTRWDPQKFIEF